MQLSTTIRQYLESLSALYSGTGKEYISFILENGVDAKDMPRMPKLDPEKDHFIQKKACFKNSYLASLIYGYDYYEGFYLTEGIGIPFEHAWNVTPETGVLVDFTALKFNIGVDAYFGVKVPEKAIKSYFNSEFGRNMYVNPLQFYFRTLKEKSNQ